MIASTVQSLPLNCILMIFFLLVESRRHNHVVCIVQHSNFLIKNICSQLLYIYWGKWHKDCEEYKRMSFHTWHDHQLSCDFEWTGGGEYYICLSAVMSLLASFLDQLPSFGTNLLAFSLALPASSGVVSVSQGSVLGSFPASQLFKSGGWSIGASASVLPMNIQDWFPLGWTGWISLQSKGLSRVFSNTTVQKHQFLSTQLSL